MTTTDNNDLDDREHAMTTDDNDTMQFNVQVKPDDGSDHARLAIGCDDGSLTIEGKGIFVVETLQLVMDALLVNPNAALAKALTGGVGQFESKEALEAVFDKALAEAGIDERLNPNG
jgi:hypothetical protein